MEAGFCVSDSNGRVVSQGEDREREGGLKSETIYLMQGKGANTESGQLHCVQQGDLDHPVCLCAPIWPVLVTLYLQG